jgi:hypothetical protein
MLCRTQIAWICAVSAALLAEIASLGMAGEATTATKRVKTAGARGRPSNKAARLAQEKALTLEVAKSTGLTSDVVRLTNDYIQKYKPLLARDLDGLRETNFKVYRARLLEMAQYARQLEAIKDPARRARREQVLALEGQSELIGARYKESAEAARSQTETELKAILDKLFDLKIEDDKAQLEQTRKNVEAQQATMEQRRKNKERVVDRELTRMLGISESLAW